MRVRLAIFFPAIYFFVMICSGGLGTLTSGKDVGLVVSLAAGWLLGWVIDSESGANLSVVCGHLGWIIGLIVGAILAGSISSGFIHWLYVVFLYGLIGGKYGASILGGFINFVRGLDA